MKKTLFVALLISSICAITVSIYYYYDFLDIKKTEATVKNLYYNEKESPLESKSVLSENNVNKNKVKEKFQPLLDLNKDTIGWINILNTDIDYPVVKTDNNDYYLKHNVMNEESSEGAIFMDYRNNIEDYSKNTIIYGHNMKNGTMFNDLLKFKDKEFFGENNIIFLDTIKGKTRWEIFSVYVTDTSFYYIQTDFGDSIEFNEFLEVIKGKSLFERNIDIDSDDKILTLSTCSYEFNNARFVVHAKKID